MWDRNTGEAGLQRDRLAGHAHRPDLQQADRPTAARTASARRRACRSPPTSRARRCAGSSTTWTAPEKRAEAGRPAVRQHGHLGHLEPHRRPRRRPAHHRRQQRQPHHADGPGDPGLGPGAARRDRRAAGDAPRDQGLEPGVRRGHARRRRGHPRRGRPRRPAGGALRPDLLRGGRGQEHLRHRQLPAPQHRHRGGPVQERPHHHRRLQDRRPADGLRARGVDRDHRGARAVAARQPQADQGRAGGRGAGQDGRGQRRRATSSRRSRASSPPTGAATPAA